MTAPDRIWIAHADAAREYDVLIKQSVKPTDYPFPVTEYIRADLVPPAALEVAALVDEVARLKGDRPFIVGANHGYDTAMEQVAELLDAMEEVLRISDRDHAAWHRANAAIAALAEEARHE